MINFEGGADAKEYHTQYVFDRVNTFGTAFLGLTVACAQCHDHKFDPITSASITNSTPTSMPCPRAGWMGDGNAAPVLELPTPEQKKELDRLQANIRGAEKEQKELAEKADAAQREWENTNAVASRTASGLGCTRARNASSQGGATLTVQPDHSVLASGLNPAADVVEIVARTERTGITGLRLGALTDPSLVAAGPGARLMGILSLPELMWRCAPRRMQRKCSRCGWWQRMRITRRKNLMCRWRSMATPGQAGRWMEM